MPGHVMFGHNRLTSSTHGVVARSRSISTIVSLAQPQAGGAQSVTTSSSNGVRPPPAYSSNGNSGAARRDSASQVVSFVPATAPPAAAPTAALGASWSAWASGSTGVAAGRTSRAAAASTAIDSGSAAGPYADIVLPDSTASPYALPTPTNTVTATAPPSSSATGGHKKVPLGMETFPDEAPLAEKFLTAGQRRRQGTAVAQPLLPVVDPRELRDALLGEPVMDPQLKAVFRMDEPGIGPRLYKPDVPLTRNVDVSQLPLLYYLPGIDGTGLAAYRQFRALSEHFDLQALRIPPEDRTTFKELVDWFVAQLEATAAETPNSRPIYLLGESSGALLALAAAQRCSAVDRVVICNPATSFADSLWPIAGAALTRLPAALYRLLPVALSPLLTNPVAIAQRNVDQADTLPRQLSDLAYGLLDLLPEVSNLRLVLPPATLAWRLEQLAVSAAFVNSILTKIPQRVLLLAGQRDRVLPNADEVPRLKKLLPRCATRVLPRRSHAMLLEAGVNLVDIMKEEGFYVRTRRLTSDATGKGKKDGKRLGANFGAAAALELPTLRELDLAAEAGSIKTLRRFVSPVFFSTRSSGGAKGSGDDASVVVRGLGGLPELKDGPLLFVGPHSLFAPDMPIMVEELLRDRGMLLRGLAHPIALNGIPDENGSTSKDGSNPFGNFLATFGAVPVNGRNMHKLFAQGEAVLLYPGGVREALKYKNEKHQLKWPSRPEFIRMAARFGATIVPFAHIGAEDSLNLVLDGRELLNLPIIGEQLRRQAERVPQARTGVNASEENLDSFVQPIIAPRPPARFYYLFGKPISTNPDMAKDKEACDALYGKVKSDVEAGMSYLLTKRQQDPYAALGKRLLYEFAWGGKPAPTFMT